MISGDLALVAQWQRRLVQVQEVVGSNPSQGTSDAQLGHMASRQHEVLVYEGSTPSLSTQ